MVAFDASEMRAFAADLHRLPEALNRHAEAIVERGALNIKNRMVTDMRASTHFRPVARSITYDVRTGGWGDTAAIEAEIGPDKARDQAASLANIAYFGSSRGGGGTVRDPQSALDAETDEFIAQLDALMDEVFPR